MEFQTPPYIPETAVNRIGQSGLLLMLLYLYYNLDLLDVPTGCNELGLGYVNDMVLLAVVKDFRQAHRRLKQMMTHPGGAIAWSGAHNSCFKATKSILVDFTCLRTKQLLEFWQAAKSSHGSLTHSNGTGGILSQMQGI